MVKISFIASGIILGLATISSASASIISRSFLDQALTDYATNTALDLKANQSDFTDLNTQISDSFDMLSGLLDQGSNIYMFVGDTINPEKLPKTIRGVFDLLHEYLNGFAGSVFNGWTNPNGKSYAGFRDLNNGWTDSEGKTYLGVKGLNDKIGTLPEGITLENFYKGWVDSGGESMAKYIATQGGKGMVYTYDPVNDDVRPERFPDVGYLDVLASLMVQEGFVPAENSVLAPFFYLTKQAMRVGEIPRDKTVAGMIDDITNNIDLSVEGSIAALMGYESGHKTRVKAVLNQLFMPIPEFPNFYNLGWRILEGGAFPKFAQEKYGIPGYKGLVDLTKGVGDLPSGIFPIFPEYELLFPYLNQPDTYPTSLAELITAIYGNSETGAHGLLSAIIHGFPLNGSPDEHVGLVPNFYLAKYIKDIADANTAKIGTLPSGNFREFPGYDLLFPWLNQPYTYPTSLAELITAIYGNSETGQMGLLEGIIAGFGIDTDGDGQFDSNIGTLSNFGLAKNAIDLANANATKIGDLPTEYATVGAALTAMKSDIDAKNLPSTSDDGQYVLSAKKVGDTITYTWVRMDLTSEEQAQ